MNKVKKTFPSTVFGHEMPLGVDKDSKKVRRKLYVKESIAFAIIMGVLDGIMMLFVDDYEVIDIFKSNALNYTFSIMFNLLIGFTVSYLLDYLFCELAVKKHNKKGIN